MPGDITVPEKVKTGPKGPVSTLTSWGEPVLIGSSQIFLCIKIKRKDKSILKGVWFVELFHQEPCISWQGALHLIFSDP